MSKKLFVLLIPGLLILLNVVGCNESTSASPTDKIELESQDIQPISTPTSEFPIGFPTPDPELYAACLDQGGRWQILGLISGPGCNLPTSDAGQPCRDSEACDGSCLANSDGLIKVNEIGLGFPDLDAIEALNAQEEEVVGYCSEWKSNKGILILVENGKVKSILAD